MTEQGLATATQSSLSQLNIGRIRYEIDDPRMADFTNNRARVNGLAERTPGFVWRYIDESGNSTSTRPYADPKIAINLSVWENVEALELGCGKTTNPGARDLNPGRRAPNGPPPCR